MAFVNHLRVLLVCDWFLKYTGSLALALQKSGVEVGLLCRDHFQEFDNDQEEYLELIDGLRNAKIEVFVVPGRVSSLKAIPGLLRVARELGRWKPDIAHAQENHDPRLLALTRRYPYLLTVHDPVLHPGEKPIEGVRALFYREWIRSAARVIVHGERLIGPMAQLTSRQPILVIPHGASSRATPLAPPSKRAVLLFGRLEPYKGIPILLEAMNIVWEQRPDVKLRVFGKGPERRHLTPDPRLEASTEYVPEANLESLFSRASLVVLPYTDGSQSGVGLQALACGVPVILADVGALPDLAVNPTFVVRPGDPSSLAAGLLRHLDHGRAMRDEVLLFVRQHLSWDVVARKTLRAYESVISEKARELRSS